MKNTVGLGNINRYFKEKLKDKKFRKLYELERKKVGLLQKKAEKFNSK